MAGLYVHIPYCHSKCAYCDFYSSPNAKSIAELVAAIGDEWAMRANEVSEPIETIYIGGGTPSLLSSHLFTTLTSSLPVSASFKEFTVEANPEDVTDEIVATWVHNGVGRVSMGIQSFDDNQLKEIERRHSSADAVNAVNTLRKNGISNISLDLIYGLPGQNLASWKKSLDTLLAIHPEHFSAYILSYEPGTRLYARLISGKITEADDDLISEMYEYLCQAAKAAGYEHYEISNFALPGHRAVHNANYWKFKPYVGLGPSAHSFDGNVRRINPSNTKTYLHAIQSHHIAAEIEEENSTDTLNDKIMVALRTAEGLDLNSLTSEQRQAIMQRAKHVPADHIHQHDTRIFIPEHRFLVSDAIIRTLME